MRYLIDFFEDVFADFCLKMSHKWPQKLEIVGKLLSIFEIFCNFLLRLKTFGNRFFLASKRGRYFVQVRCTLFKETLMLLMILKLGQNDPTYAKKSEVSSS